MSQQLNAEQAQDALSEVKQRRQAVVAQGPNERLVAFWWTVFVLVCFPLFDFISPATAGAITIVAGVIGFIITVVYGIRRERKVKPRSKDLVFWVPWTIWYLFTLYLAGVYDDRFMFAFTSAALASAIPAFAFILWPRRSYP